LELVRKEAFWLRPAAALRLMPVGGQADASLFVFSNEK
jgi:hypothetical protein